MDIFNACKFMKYSLLFEFPYMRGKVIERNNKEKDPWWQVCFQIKKYDNTFMTWKKIFLLNYE